MPSAGSYTSKIGYLSVAKNVKVQLPGGVSNTFRPGLPDMCSDFKTTTPATTKTTGGIITTFAGNGQQSIPTLVPGLAVNSAFYNPTCVIADSDGNIFHVEVIEESLTDPDTGDITTIVATAIFKTDTNGVMTFTGIGYEVDLVNDGFDNRITCLTIDNPTNTIYFCNRRFIYRLDAQEPGYIASEVYSVPSSAGFEISHIAVNSAIDENVFYASATNNEKIYRITLGSTPTQGVFVTHTGIAQGSMPITVDSEGHLYVTVNIYTGTGPARRQLYFVKKFSRTSTPSESVILWSVECGNIPRPTLFGNNPVDCLTGITIGPDGSVYVSDAHVNLIRRIDSMTQDITTVAGGGPLPSFSGDGGPAIQSNLAFPQGIAFDSNSNLFICDTQNFRIRKVTPFVTTTIPGKTTYNPPWFAPVEYAEACKCKVVTTSAEFPQNIIYDGQ